MGIEEKTPNEILREFFEEKDLKSMSKEVLKHWENITANVLELKKMSDSDSSINDMYYWLILLMFLYPVNNLPLDIFYSEAAKNLKK